MAGVSKRYGHVRALEAVSLRVNQGEVVGLLGPNGAGKSTMLRILVGLVRPSEGTVRVLGHPMPQSRAQTLERVGAVIEGPAFYGHLSGSANLEMLRRCYRTVPRDRVQEVLARVGLAKRATDTVATYSVGMRKRLALAAALLPRPELLLLDEPTTGLDPIAVEHVERVLAEETGERRAAVLLSSHQLHEVSRTCTRVVVLRSGRVVSDQLLMPERDCRTVVGVSEPARAVGWLRSQPGVEAELTGDGLIVVSATGIDRPTLVARLVGEGFRVDRVTPYAPSLADEYKRLQAGDSGESTVELC